LAYWFDRFSLVDAIESAVQFVQCSRTLLVEKEAGDRRRKHADESDSQPRFVMCWFVPRSTVKMPIAPSVTITPVVKAT
jgi:hypothetical protein